MFYKYINQAAYLQFGAFELEIQLLRELFPDGENNLPKLISPNHQSTILNSLANSYSLNGQPLRAIPLYKTYISISKNANDNTNIAIGLANIAYMAQIPTGSLRIAQVNLQNSIETGKREQNPFTQAIGYLELGRLYIYLGDLGNAEENLNISLQIFQIINVTKD